MEVWRNRWQNLGNFWNQSTKVYGNFCYKRWFATNLPASRYKRPGHITSHSRRNSSRKVQGLKINNYWSTTVNNAKIKYNIHRSLINADPEKNGRARKRALTQATGKTIRRCEGSSRESGRTNKRRRKNPRKISKAVKKIGRSRGLRK